MSSALGKQVAAKFLGTIPHPEKGSWVPTFPSQLVLNSEVDTREVRLLSVNTNGIVYSLSLFMLSIES
jgi:hypothetical protein